MSQTRTSIETLKQELCKQRITCRQVSEAPGLSETSVRRLYADAAFSVRRLEKVCELRHLEIGDLVHLRQKNIEFSTRLSREQEEEMISDTRLLPLEQRFGTGPMVAIRSWEAREFPGLRRTSDQRMFG